MPVQTDELARQIQQTNDRLREVIDALHSEGTALRGEIGDLKTAVGKINNSLGWMKGITGLAGASLLGVAAMVYQAGERAGRIEGAIASLQKTTDEIGADLKTRDRAVVDAIAEARKINEELRTGMKGQSDDLSRIQTTLDRLADSVGQMRRPPR